MSPSVSPLSLWGTETFSNTGVFLELMCTEELFLQMKQHFGSNTTFLVLLHPCEQGIAALAASCADAGGRAAFVPLSPSLASLSPLPFFFWCFFFYFFFLRKVVNINRSWNE